MYSKTIKENKYRCIMHRGDASRDPGKIICPRIILLSKHKTHNFQRDLRCELHHAILTHIFKYEKLIITSNINLYFLFQLLSGYFNFYVI